MLADALEHLVRGIVEHPDDVKVRLRQQRHRWRFGYIPMIWVEGLVVRAEPLRAFAP